MRATLASVETGASFWRPSRGPTSRRLILAGRSLTKARLAAVTRSRARRLRLVAAQPHGVQQRVSAHRPGWHPLQPVALVALQRRGHLLVDERAARTRDGGQPRREVDRLAV